MRIGVADPLLLPKRVDPVGFLLKGAEAWAVGRVAAGGGVLEIGSRRPVPDEDGSGGLAATLVGLAIDAPRLVDRVDTGTQRVDLEDAAEHAQGVVDAVVAVVPLAGRAERGITESCTLPYTTLLAETTD